MADHASYVQLVNRRLTAAYFHLLIEKNSEITATNMQQSACIESALLQVYFGLLGYLNELLCYYKKPLLKDAIVNFDELMEDKQGYFADVYEFNELRQWVKGKRGLFYSLLESQYFLSDETVNNVDGGSHNKPHYKTDKMLDEKKSSATNRVKPANLIAVSTLPPEREKLSVSTVSELLDQLQQLIDRQRESQLEY